MPPAQTVVSITEQNPKADAPDRVDRKFLASASNQLSLADVTYVPTVQSWLYLACVSDVLSRPVIGWSMARHRKTDLVVDAVSMAVHRRGGHVPGVIHHSDRGGEGEPASEWCTTPVTSCAARPRCHSAISRASRGRSVRMVRAARQPTIMRENTSTTKAT